MRMCCRFQGGSIWLLRNGCGGARKRESFPDPSWTQIGVSICIKRGKRKEGEGLVLEQNVYVRGQHGRGIGAERRDGGLGCGRVKALKGG